MNNLIISNKYELIIEPSKSLFDLKLKELWSYRELLFFLIWRDIKIKYKQSLFGISWAIFQPLISILVFTLIFDKIAKLPSGGVPYPLYSVCGIIVWNYFSQSLQNGTSSLIISRNLITKVYFPRLLVPLSAIGGGILDFSISLVIAFILLAYYKIAISFNILLILFFSLLLFLVVTAVCLWTSAVSVKYRDVPHAIPFLTRMLFWVTPVAYGAEAIPQKYMFIYSLNPLYCIIEGFRFSMLKTPLPSLSSMFISFLMVLILSFSGIIYFKNMEKEFADII